MLKSHEDGIDYLSAEIHVKQDFKLCFILSKHNLQVARTFISSNNVTVSTTIA